MYLLIFCHFNLTYSLQVTIEQLLVWGKKGFTFCYTIEFCSPFLKSFPRNPIVFAFTDPNVPNVVFLSTDWTWRDKKKSHRANQVNRVDGLRDGFNSSPETSWQTMPCRPGGCPIEESITDLSTNLPNISLISNRERCCFIVFNLYLSEL